MTEDYVNVIVKIPISKYEWLLTHPDSLNICENAIKHGTFLSAYNATNGDIMKKIFSNATYKEDAKSEDHVFMSDESHSDICNIDADWWFARYIEGRNLNE